MSRIAYVNGRYVQHAHAAVHIEDRGYQFADGVYEVIAVRGGCMIDEDGHLRRLDRSLGELRIDWPVAPPVLSQILREVIRRNLVKDGIVYLQVTRGVAKRDHPFPKDAEPALVITARPQRPARVEAMGEGIAVITVPDIRWKRRDIKTTSLLPNVLAKQQAREAGAFEAWMVEEDGTVTEGTSTNAWIVTRAGELVTRAPSEAILNGITRLAVLELAQEEGLKLVERPFTVEEALAAREAFLTSTTSYVLPVVAIDGHKVGDGRPGRFGRRLREIYIEDYMARAGTTGRAA
jgi:D-alanine transaminase